MGGLKHANNQMGGADGHGLENKAAVQTNFLLTLVAPLLEPLLTSVVAAMKKNSSC